MKIECPKCGESFERDGVVLARLAERQQFNFRLVLEPGALLSVSSATETVAGFARCLEETARVLGGNVLVTIMAMSFIDQVLDVTLLVCSVKKPVDAVADSAFGPSPLTNVARSLDLKDGMERAQMDALALGANLSSVVNPPDGSLSEPHPSFLAGFTAGAWRRKDGTLESVDRTQTLPDWPKEWTVLGKTYTLEFVKDGATTERGTWENAEYV